MNDVHRGTHVGDGLTCPLLICVSCWAPPLRHRSAPSPPLPQRGADHRSGDSSVALRAARIAVVQHPLHDPVQDSHEETSYRRYTGADGDGDGNGQVVGQRRDCSAGIPSANAARTLPPNNVVRRIPPSAALDGIKLSSVRPTSRDVRGRSRAAALAPRQTCLN
ncbi:MAG: hypothetical protein MI924_24710 [Chloroflexales bacterium]|nr:hypothetical protein [Chloroflexales bacterium]